MKAIVLLSVSAIVFGISSPVALDGTGEKDNLTTVSVRVVNQGDPEHSISDVMKKAHGAKGLAKKAIDGDASDEELKELVKLYVDMLDNDPPKGKKEDWQKSSTAVVLAATRVMLGQEGAGEELKKATNCKACHDNHK
ncbi:MAG TPA: hypothetical protein PKD64_09585 [Pirellulaceae bacterium]|nr:hypothetical protein [Pirellulaceae bacterium]HMO92437.1 hypothetical protein [Pirellulaceae bacterium]HMP67893.1 hypothetical protein [Pirellulaceae bacterium]